MPIYEYRCSNCSHEFEESQSIKASSLLTCPQCKQEKLNRVIGLGGGMIFKGSGFYQTDYKNSGTAKKDSAANKEPSAEKKPEAKSATPPAPAADTSKSEK
ncbi:MAG: zinc ribbon domain-containing protein [Bacteroidota bacterium]